ncbi:Non-specific serine/threonine protein kinase protein [Dioscorea alata]|uniref:Non-specific serine/threonine protein kinase protein n=1 Tax=Dioscorea alata TaxID=55571 RepID=A0ACB7UUZ7_DIOAL|nr:Non-specific serine/threonine protein kinase protein [Dioscorea alata]
MASLLLHLFLLFSIPLSSPCSDLCADLQIPSPFRLNASCGPPIDAFLLSCPPNSTSPFLSLASALLRVIDFRSSGTLLLDYSSNSSSSSCDRWYSDLDASAVFSRSSFFAITANNVLRLYDCEDSSVCKTGCEEINGGRCERNGTSFGCCYPLSDGSVWKTGDGFGVFSEFGCRGFSSWVVGRGQAAQRGIEVEWAVPRGYSEGEVCSVGATVVNATAVPGGVRCSCNAGMVGDGFKHGTGCSKPSNSDGRDGCNGKHSRKRVTILAVVLGCGLLLTATVAFLWFVLRQSSKGKRWDLDPACLPKILGNACRTRLFTYEELKEATKGFEDHKVVAAVDGTVHTGVLDDGSLVAVQKVRCETQQNLRQVLERVELLSQISHRNIARIIGCSIGSGYTLLLVHEFFSSRTLEELLQQGKGNGLNWYNRISIATEIASAVAYLQYEISPPIYIQDLNSHDIFVEINYSVKVASFKFLSSVGTSSDANVIANFGLILLELVVGSKCGDMLGIVLPKIEDRKFREIVDPCLGYAEELPVQREQIETVACLALKCLSSRENEGVCIVGIAKELMNILNGFPGSSSSRMRPSLEETFSNSSLLQMISMSPDSLHVP